MFFKEALKTFIFLSILAGTVSFRLLGQVNGLKKDQKPQWEKIGPGGGGAIFIPTFSYHRTSDFLLRCDMTGSYLTKNGGKSYDQINFPNGAGSFAYDPADSNTIYIGSNTLNRSKDGGKTWEQLFPAKADVLSESYSGDHANYEIKTKPGSLYGMAEGRIGTIHVDPVRSSTLYFGMGQFLFYSFNAGKSWEKRDVGKQIDYLYSNKSGLKSELIIFTAESVFVFNKNTRKIIPKIFPKAMSPAFSFTAGSESKGGKEIFYALHHDPEQEIQEEFGHSEVWVSEDRGSTWVRSLSPFIANTKAGIKPSYSMISCAEFDARQVYLVTNRYEEKKDKGFIYWYGALKTGDAGKTWDWVWKGGGGSGQYGVKDGIDVGNLKDAWTAKAFGGEYIRLMDVGVSPLDGKVAIVTDWYRTMKTIDGGKSWDEIYSEPQTDGTFKSRGLDVTTSYGVHFDPFDSSHIAISYTDIGFHHSFNGGKSWVRSADGVPIEWVNTCYWVEFDPEVKGKVWSVWSGMHDYPRGKMTRNPAWKQRAKGGVCVSHDGGKTWQPSIEGMGMDSPATSIILDPTSAPGKRTLYASVYSKGVFKSTDDGKTWQLKNKGIGENTCAFELTRTGNGTLFLTVSATPMHKSGKKGREFYSGAVYRSTDGAENWTKLNVADGLLFPNGIEYDRRNPDRIYLAGWADIDLSDLIGGDVARSTGKNEKLEIPGGIFLSEDGGTTWKSIFDKKQYVYDVTADPYHPRRLYCNTFNSVAYRSDDYGKTWNKIKGYDFHWGQRITVDQNDPEQIYINTFGSSVWHGVPLVDKVKSKNPNGRNDAWGYVGFGGGGAMFYPAVSPHNPDRAMVACDMTGSFATYNGGRSWRMFNLKGPVDYFVFDPIDSNTVYANSIALFKSTDRGNTWSIFYPSPSNVSGIVSQGDHANEKVITKDSTAQKVLALTVDPADSKKLYAAISIDGKSGFYTSQDGGNSWKKERDLAEKTKNIYINPDSPQNDRTVFICGKNTITKREKGNWKINQNPNVKELTEFSGGFDKKNKNFIIYAISGTSYFNPDEENSGIYYTKDGGETWENRQRGLAKFAIKGAEMPEWRSIATSAQHPEVVYVSYANLKVHADTTSIGVAKSEDFGQTWKLAWKDDLTKKVNVVSKNFVTEWINERFGPGWGENPFSIGVSPSDPDICYATDFGRTIKSQNGGKTWEQVYTEKKEGAGWISRGLEVTTSYAVVFDPFDISHVFIANTDIGLMESKDGGTSWLSDTQNNGVPRAWANSTYWMEFDPKKKGRVWAVMSGTHDLPRPKMWRKNGTRDYQGGVLLSEDAGKTWNPVSQDIGEGAMTHILIDAASNPESRTLYVCVFGKGVYKSGDGGKTWKPKNNGIEGNEPFAWRIIKREKDNTLFLVVNRRSEDGRMGAGDGALYRSTNGAESWTKMTLPNGTNGPTSLAIDPENPQRLILSAWGRKAAGQFSADTGGGIFVSDDDGQTWKNVLQNDQHMHDITYDARINTFYACGFNGSAYRSEDSGNSWTRIKGYNFKWGKRVEPDPRDPEKIFIVTFGGGIWHGPAKGDETAQEDIISEADSTIIHEINYKEIPAGKKTIAITGATIIDGNGGEPIQNGCVIVENGKILEVGKNGDVTIPAGAEIVDGKGMSLLPGFIDSHFHLDGEDGLTSLFLQHGVTSLRDPGAWIEAYDGERKSKNAVPRLFLADPHLDMFPPAYPKDAYVVRDALEAVNQVNRMADRGASVIKVYFRLPPGIIEEVCKAAHKRGLPVTGHLETTEAMEAINAGLDGIEHITSFGLSLQPQIEGEKYRQMVLADNNARKNGRYDVWNKLDINGWRVDTLLHFLVKKGTFVSPTLGAFEYRMPADTAKEAGDSTKLIGFNHMKALTAKLKKGGVKIVLGSHSMITYAETGWAFQRELQLFVESGISPSDAIVAATMENARYFRIDDRLGSIEKGKIADLILVKGNPVQDIKATRNVVKVMLNGLWVK
jgi:imidazolonepropionase-like amidohydrolase/photosystem II stability/assembly factor-like uncharacterized protein